MRLFSVLRSPFVLVMLVLLFWCMDAAACGGRIKALFGGGCKSAPQSQSACQSAPAYSAPAPVAHASHAAPAACAGDSCPRSAPTRGGGLFGFGILGR